MNQYAKLIDISKCVGCRACEVACKEWNETGIDDGNDRPFGYQSHHDLTHRTWNIVKFYEFSPDKSEQPTIVNLRSRSRNNQLNNKLSEQSNNRATDNSENQPQDGLALEGRAAERSTAVVPNYLPSANSEQAAFAAQYNLLLGPEPEFNPQLSLPSIDSSSTISDTVEIVGSEASNSVVTALLSNESRTTISAEVATLASSVEATTAAAEGEPATVPYSVWQVANFLAQDSALSVVERASLPRWMFRKHGCMHCTEAACVAACPVDALQRNEALGYVRLNVDTCTGCGYCVDACPFGVPQLAAGAELGFGKVSKCRLCSDRMQHGMQPACVQSCPPNALEFGPRTEMVALGRARVADLTARGYQEAYLYGETELGGLNVLTVLPSRPRDFDLPENPQMPGYLQVWKKIVQPLGALAIAGTALALGFSFFNSRRQKGSGHGSH